MSATELKLFDAADYLSNAEEIESYLNAAFEEGDAAFMLEALGTVARAAGMSDLSNRSGVSRSALYRALGAQGRTEFETVARVIKAMGLRLRVVTAPTA